MNTALPRRGLARHIAALSTSVAAVTLVTLAIFALDSFAPVLSLGVLYVFAVLPVAVLFGLAYALPVSVASMLAFNWFFLPPQAHAPAERLGELDRARRLPRDGGRRQRPRRAVAAPRGRGGEAGARGVAARGGRRLAPRERATSRTSCAGIVGPRRRGPRSRGEAGSSSTRCAGRSPASPRYELTRRGAQRRAASSSRRNPIRSLRAEPVHVTCVPARRRDRPRAARTARRRGRDPAPERRDQDRDPPVGQPRPALSADRDPRRDRRARELRPSS